MGDVGRLENNKQWSVCPFNEGDDVGHVANPLHYGLFVVVPQKDHSAHLLHYGLSLCGTNTSAPTNPQRGTLAATKNSAKQCGYSAMQ